MEYSKYEYLPVCSAAGCTSRALLHRALLVPDLNLLLTVVPVMILVEYYTVLPVARGYMRYMYAPPVVLGAPAERDAPTVDEADTSAPSS